MDRAALSWGKNEGSSPFWGHVIFGGKSMPEQIEPAKDYIGDGVYIEFDGYMVSLTTPRENGMHEVCIEPAVLDGFLNYIKRCENSLLKAVLDKHIKQG